MQVMFLKQKYPISIIQPIKMKILMSMIISDIGFLWANTSLGFVYEITIVGNKLRKQLTMSKTERKKILMDKSRVWNMKRTWKKILLLSAKAE